MRKLLFPTLCLIILTYASAFAGICQQQHQSVLGMYAASGGAASCAWTGGELDYNWVVDDSDPDDSFSWDSGDGTAYDDDVASPGTPPTCSGAYSLRVYDLDTGGWGYQFYTWGGDISDDGGSWGQDVEIIVEFYVDAVTASAAGDDFPFLTLDDDDDCWDDYGIFGLQLEEDTGVWELQIGTASPGEVISSNLALDTWHTVKIHLDTTDSSSWAALDTDNDDDFSDESEIAFTRGSQTATILKIGPMCVSGRMQQAGDTYDIYFGYIAVGAPSL